MSEMRSIFDSTIDRLLSDKCGADVALRADGGAWLGDLWSEIVDSGFGLAAVPEAAGGAGATWADLYGVVHATGFHALPLPLAEMMLANAMLAACGLEPLAEGVLTIAADARLSSANGKVSGQLAGVPWGRQATHVLAIVPGAAPRLVLLAAADAAQCEQVLNTAGEPRDTLHFDAVSPVAEAALPAGMGADALLVGGAMLRTAQTAGALQRALDISTQYAGERKQFGKALASFQAIQHQLAQMAEQTGLANASSEAAFAESSEQWNLWSIASAKILSAEAAAAVASMAHTIHGAIGFTHEHSLHLSTRRLWSWRSELGNHSYWAQRLGRAVCAGGSDAMWPAVTQHPFTLQESSAS